MTQLQKILKLSIQERILWVETILESIAAETAPSELTEEHKKILDEELIAYKKNPSAGSSWKNVKTRILKSKK